MASYMVILKDNKYKTRWVKEFDSLEEAKEYKEKAEMGINIYGEIKVIGEAENDERIEDSLEEIR